MILKKLIGIWSNIESSCQPHAFEMLHSPESCFLGHSPVLSVGDAATVACVPIFHGFRSRTELGMSARAARHPENPWRQLTRLALDYCWIPRAQNHDRVAS